ncbi:MAG: hypothetical protein J5623_07270 [Clostridiales bacterium]|nr:hypothetical protein [Clostridiales bacterium]
MVVKVKADQLDEAIRSQLETYNADVARELNKGLKDVADKTADTLKKGGSYRERTGKYTPDWSVTERPGRSVMQGEEYSVHNRKHYQLTHLLEKGHVTRNGKRTRAFAHIAPAEQAAQDLAVKAVEEAVRAANAGI